MIAFLEDLWEAFALTDALDILVVSLLIYRVLVILKGTRAIRVLGGLLVLVVLYAASKLLSLTTVYWILENISLYLVLAVVVLFQEDIRRGLARVGNPLFSARGKEAGSNTLHEVSRGCFRLADQGHGALIVLERDAALDDLQEGATVLDARLCEEILVAIFQPTSPIHDGAVLLREGRLAVAGAFLPLSTRADLPTLLGTRHRAALGLVETTDALVFVVSEERRAVSIAFRGDLHLVDTPDQLRLKVQELLSTEAEEEQASSGTFPAARTPSASFPPEDRSR